jgi:hypothetical protein
MSLEPTREAIVRLVGAVLAEQNDEWTEQRRYVGKEILAAATRRPTRKEANHLLSLPGSRVTFSNTTSSGAAR